MIRLYVCARVIALGKVSRDLQVDLYLAFAAMVYTAEQQFISRAKKALETGNTSFVARGKNNAIWEKLKHEFEQKRTATTESPAKRAKTSSSSSSSSESSNDATDVTPTIEHVKNEEDVIPMIAEVNDQEDVADVTKIVEGREITPAEPPPANSKAKDKDENLTLSQKPLMSDWTKEILHSFHPRAVVEWSEYAQTRRTNETLNAIIRVAQMLTELEGKDIDECKEEVDIRQKYGADMIWTRNFELKFSDTEHAMTIHEFVSFTPLLCTVRLIDSVAVQ